MNCSEFKLNLLIFYFENKKFNCIKNYYKHVAFRFNFKTTKWKHVTEERPRLDILNVYKNPQLNTQYFICSITKICVVIGNGLFRLGKDRNPAAAAAAASLKIENYSSFRRYRYTYEHNILVPIFSAYRMFRVFCNTIYLIFFFFCVPSYISFCRKSRPPYYFDCRIIYRVSEIKLQ